MALDHLGRLQRRKATQTLAAIGSADIRVVTMTMADRLHNMRTLRFLPQAKQLRKAREVLDIFLPMAGQLSLDIACRLLDAPKAKAALKAAPGPLLLVISDGTCRSAAGLGGPGRETFTVRVAGREHPGWVWEFAPVWA